MSDDSHSLPVLPVEGPDGGRIAASSRRRGSLEAYEAAPDQQFVNKIRRHDSLNEFRMQHGAKPGVTVVSSVPPSIPEATESKKSGARKPASRGDASSSSRSPFAAAFGNASSSSSQFTSKIKRGDTLKQFKTPASIQSIFGSVSDEPIDEDVVEEPAPAASAKKSKGQSSPFSSLLSGSGVSPSQQFATKITSRDTLKQFKPPTALSAALFTAPSSALSAFDQSSIEEAEEDHFASPPRRESGGKRNKASPAAAAAVSPATAFKQQLSELPDQKFSQKIQASDTLKVFKKQPSLTDTNLFDPPSASLFTQTAPSNPNDKSKKGRALPQLTEESRAPVFNTALTQLPDQKFASKIKRNDTLRAYKQPPAISSSFFAPPPTEVTEVEEAEEEEEDDEEDEDDGSADLLRTSAAALSESKAELEQMRAQMKQLMTGNIDEEEEEEEEEEDEPRNGKHRKVTQRPNKVPARPPVAGRQVSTVVEEADGSDSEDDATKEFLKAMRAQLGAVPADISPGKPDLDKKKSIGVLPDVAFARRITRNDSLVQFDLASKKKDADAPPPKPFAAWGASSQPAPTFTAPAKSSAADLAAARAALNAAASQFTEVSASQLSAPVAEVRRRSDIGVRSKGSRSPNRQKAQKQQQAKSQQASDASLQSAYAQFTAFNSALSDSDEESAPASKFPSLSTQAPPAASKLRASSVMPTSAKAPASASASVVHAAKPVVRAESKAPAHEAQKLAALKRAKTVSVEHRRTQSAVSERNLLGELFKAINTMSASGAITPAQKGQLKDLVIRQDSKVMEAALQFAQDNSFDNLSSKLLSFVDNREQPNPFIVQYVTEAKRLFDEVDSDKDGYITKEQVHIALVSSRLPLTPEQLKEISALSTVDFSEFVKVCVRNSLDLTALASR